MKTLPNAINNTLNRIDSSIDNMRFLTGSAVKIIAIIAMFIDHFSKIILQMLLYYHWNPLADAGKISAEQFQHIDTFIHFWLQGIGTIAFPLFCFLLSEGFFYTRNRKRYISMMLIFAFISEIPFDLSFFSSVATQQGTFPFYFQYQNVFFTLFLGLVALSCIDGFSYKSNDLDYKKSKKIISLVLQIAGIAAAAIAAELIHCDYKSRGVLFIVAFYICRKNRIYQILLFLLIYILTTKSYPTLFTSIACLIILLYNGKRGNLKLKYFFYIFYPMHLALLYVASYILEWHFI